MVSWDGSVNTDHQPLALMSCGVRSEETSSPIVGTSQNRPTRISTTRTSPPLSLSAIREATDRPAGTAPDGPVFPTPPTVAVIAAPPA